MSNLPFHKPWSTFSGVTKMRFKPLAGCLTKLWLTISSLAVLKRITGQAPELNPRYQDFANHCGFKIAPCGVRRGNEKGRVENGVGYVKKNFLNGLDIPSFNTLNPAAGIWLNEIANVRLHGETHEKPIERFEQEKNQCPPVSALPFDM